MAKQKMNEKNSWDFRKSEELRMSYGYTQNGYIVESGDPRYLELLKKDIKNTYFDFAREQCKNKTSLEEAHRVVSHSESNDLRLYIMKKLFNGTTFQRNYYYAAKKIIHNLCGNELAMQKRPGLSINLPNNPNDVLPIHADTWNGVSPFELNIWIPFVNCSNTMCLYILNREKYKKRITESRGLLQLSSDELFVELYDDLTWIPIEYGKVLAFDQSLPHGFSLNQETVSHWSMNCRFKGLNTPYWDKKLGEYFMPITVKNCTRLGMNYEHPENWV